LKVTSGELLKLTNGIVQGMSGSPIIQNGKIIGAVTHVFVDDSTCGYGIFIDSTGIPNIRRNNIYNKTNIPPPLLPATYGKRHTFPIPIAQPALISMNPSLLPNFSLSIVS